LQNKVAQRQEEAELLERSIEEEEEEEDK